MSLIRLLDVSGIFHPCWRIKESAGKPIGEAAAETVRTLRERAAKGGADHVVACCDSGRTFRHAIGEEWRTTVPEYRGYKGNRADKDPAMMAALDRVIDELDQDGVPILRAAGFEADDVIATVTRWAVAQGHEVEIYTEDKDLMQLVGPGVIVARRDGSTVGPDEVVAKFGVDPSRLGEYLAIVGDASDHVPGVKGLGPEAAKGIIAKHGGYLEAVKKARAEDMALASGAAGDSYEPAFKPAQRTRLIDGEPAFRVSLRMTALRDDVPLDFAAVTAERVPKPKTENDNWAAQRARAANANATIAQQEIEETMTEDTQAPSAAPQIVDAPVSAPPVAAVAAPAAVPAQTTALVLPRAATPTRAVRTFEMGLEPRSYEEAMIVADHAAESRHFKDIVTPPQAMMLILLGRRFGLSAVDSLRMIHMIEGKPSMSAQLIVGIVQKSGMAEFFELKESSNTSATWVTKRRGNRYEMSWTFTVEDAKTARLGAIGKLDDAKRPRTDFDPNSNWAKYPKIMCMWRAAVFLARAVYTDLVGGLYMPDEVGGDEVEIDGNPPVLGDMGQAA